MDKKHELITELKRITAELGRVPTVRQFQANKKIALSHENAFGNYTAFVAAAGLERTSILLVKDEVRLIKQYKSICSKTEQIQGFFRHTLDLKEMFDRAGNPPTLKLSAQPDTHAKYVDRPAFNAYLKFIKYWQPHVHLIMGDFVDCEGLSHWPADNLEPRRIVPEMKTARGLLQEIVDAIPNSSTRIFLMGNHSAWIEQALTRMPELFEGLADLDIDVSLKTLLGLPKFGYDLFPLNHLVQIGKAHFTHGIYTARHHAAKHMSVFKANIYYGHLHDCQEYGETGMDGPLEASSLGCLCRLDAKFLKGKPNNWLHAHGVFEFFPDGQYTFYKPKIFSGKFAFNGQIFDGNIP